jgi:uncharacterized protein (TIGR03492 family)
LSSVLLVSNGHGEDLSGARLAAELRRRGLQVEALPLVGHGHAYRRAGIPVQGRTRQGSTGGLGYTSLWGQLTDLVEGQPFYVLQRLWLLWRRRHQVQLVVGVGDLLVVLAAWLARRPAAIYLVAYSSHYEGRLRLPWPCGWLLRQPTIRAIWSRDALTASDLSQQLARPVQFLGNPFVDGLIRAPLNGAAAGETPRPQRVLLLPGSRLPEAGRNLLLMLAVLSALPAELQHPQRTCWQAALVPELGHDQLHSLPLPPGWQWGGRWQLRCGLLQLHLGPASFEQWLGEADLVIAAAGTASEQAVALAKPVVQIVGAGPQFTASFAEAQRRLLGPGVICAPGRSGNADTLQASAALIAAQLEELGDPRRGAALRRRLHTIALERLGAAGASARLAEAIMALLPATQSDAPSSS